MRRPLQILTTLLTGMLLWPAARPGLAGPQQQLTTGADSRACLDCHIGIERMHAFPEKMSAEDRAKYDRGMDRVGLTCVDCHGGNGTATGSKTSEREYRAYLEAAHVLPRNRKLFRNSANPPDSYAALNRESPEFVRFLNPSDFRIADRTCGQCHREILSAMRMSVMSHNAMAHGAVFYNNGAFERKQALYGEAYDEQGNPAELVDSEISEGARRHGAIERLVPHPSFPITRVKDPLRVAEVNNPALGVRGPGTDGRIAGVFLNVLKTRLNDPTLWFLGSNRIAGDYRSSGCAACHVIYANDGEPDSSAMFAVYGNRGTSQSNDAALRRVLVGDRADEPGHPIRHTLELRIPASQCLTCHYHQGDGAIGSYLGRIWWDRESDAEKVKQIGAEPEYGRIDPATRRYVQERLAEFNKEFQLVQFSDFHAHGWNFTRVYLQDERGRMLDAAGQPIAPDDPLKWLKGVHLRDIHLEKGMSCIDCHTTQDTHGDGNIYPQMTDYIEIRCVDCHGTVTRRSDLKTSGHPWRRNDLTQYNTPWRDPRTGEKLKQFYVDPATGRIYQRSRLHPGLEWEVTQLVDVVNPSSRDYSPKAAYAKLVQRDGSVHLGAAGENLAHSYERMECTTCHSSWQTTCSGCHLPLDLNVKSKDKHYEDRFSRGYAPYYRQVIRTDLHFFGIGTTNHGNKITPFRPASAVIVSAWDRNRNNIVHQQPLVSSPGFANEAMTPHPPHTVRKTETRTCSDCHLNEAGSNNARIAAALGYGVNALTFMGTYVYVAEQGRGVTAVEVTEGREPMPVIGSNFHRVLHPQSYDQFVRGGRKLRTAYTRRAPRVVSVATRGEYLLAAEGSDGLKLYDVANINNKSVAQRIVQAVNSPLGEATRVPLPDATFVHLPVSLPVHVGREDRRALNRQLSVPEIRRLNGEQEFHELYRYALVADRQLGLVLVDIDTLTDADPENNRLRADVVFDGGGALRGARMVKNWGHYALVASEQTGLQVVDLRIPTAPRLVRQPPEVAAALKGARGLELQLFYAFVIDSEGLKVFRLREFQQDLLLEPVPGATIPLADARGLTISRTYLYIAGGRDGLVIVDIERPEAPRLFEYDKSQVPLSDAYDVAVATTNVSYFAYVADGRNGLAVVRLLEPPDTPGYAGFAPAPMPKLIATRPMKGVAVGVSRGQIRDRYVDESGHQIAVTNRIGSRPLNRDEMRRMLYYPDGSPLRVRDEFPVELRHEHVSTGKRLALPGSPAQQSRSVATHGGAATPSRPTEPGITPRR